MYAKQASEWSILAVGMVLGLTSVPLWASAHGEHGHEHAALELEAEPAPSPPQALDLDTDTSASSFTAQRLQNCRWRTEVRSSNAGGIFADCEEGEVPVGNGVHRTFSFVDVDPFANLGFAEYYISSTTIGDGKVDGYWLTDTHATIHGEPPENGRTAAAFAAMTNRRGTGTHIMHTGMPTESQTVATLCCEVSL